jgi:hypothetical protein
MRLTDGSNLDWKSWRMIVRIVGVNIHRVLLSWKLEVSGGHDPFLEELFGSESRWRSVFSRWCVPITPSVLHVVFQYSRRVVWVWHEFVLWDGHVWWFWLRFSVDDATDLKTGRLPSRISDDRLHQHPHPHAAEAAGRCSESESESESQKLSTGLSFQRRRLRHCKELEVKPVWGKKNGLAVSKTAWAV